MPIKEVTPQDNSEDHVSLNPSNYEGREIKYDVIFQLREEKKRLDKIQWILWSSSCFLLCFPGLITLITGIILSKNYKVGGAITIASGFFVILFSLLCCCIVGVIRRSLKGDTKFYLFLAGEQRLPEPRPQEDE